MRGATPLYAVKIYLAEVNGYTLILFFAKIV